MAKTVHEINPRIVERIGVLSKAHTQLVRSKMGGRISEEIFEGACSALRGLIEILELEGPPEYEFLTIAARGALQRLDQRNNVDWSKLFNLVPDGDAQELLTQELVRQGAIEPRVSEVNPTRFERDPVI
jgi:hypothetical protein